MRGVLIVLLIGIAVVAWVSMSWKADADTRVIKEKFESGDGELKPPAVGLTGEEKKRQMVAEIMDMYKELYGKYPVTEVLVHYRDISGSLTREELKSRIKTDGGTPPGVKVTSETAETDVGVMKPPVPGDKPILPRGDVVQDDGGALAVKLMAIASQLSSISEDLKAGMRAQPKAYESFVQF
jgi:hypothetical protein